jgi:hypothetical protein
MKDAPKLRLVNDADERNEGPGMTTVMIRCSTSQRRGQAPRLPRSKESSPSTPAVAEPQVGCIFPTRCGSTCTCSIGPTAPKSATDQSGGGAWFRHKAGKMRVLRLLEDRGLITVMPTGPRTVASRWRAARHLPR